MSGPRTIRYKVKNGVRAFRKFIIPCIQARVHGSQFIPVLSYLFTEWKCNIDCHYCFDFNNKAQRMTLDTAIQSMDWLKSVGCGVLAIMGGEPLLRKDFILKVVDYGSRNGFFVYLPTNGILMTENFIHAVGAAGVTAINLAVDCVEEIPGLPKSLSRIEPQFRYLLEHRKKYGYMVVFNINITSKNTEDVKILTEIAHDNGIGTDYHINEPPQIEQPHFKHLDSDTYIRQQHWKDVDEVIDWLIDRNIYGYPMVNSVIHLRHMKDFIRGKNPSWVCRAGCNSLFIKVDGTLAPCFALATSNHDWGRIGALKFDAKSLATQKRKCQPHCLSTCQHNLGYYYGTTSGNIQWIWQHVRLGH